AEAGQGDGRAVAADRQRADVRHQPVAPQAAAGQVVAGGQAEVGGGRQRGALGDEGQVFQGPRHVHAPAAAAALVKEVEAAGVGRGQVAAERVQRDGGAARRRRAFPARRQVGGEQPDAARDAGRGERAAVVGAAGGGEGGGSLDPGLAFAGAVEEVEVV